MTHIRSGDIAAKLRVAEISTILAQGIIRLHQKYASNILRENQNLSGQAGDSWVDFSPDRSAHAKRQNRRNA
jgi:hypothetical protein